MYKPSPSRFRPWLTGTALAGLMALSAHAVTNLEFNFDEDPSSILTTYHNAVWYPENGNPASGGYLSITDNIDSQTGIIVFDDFDDGLIVKGFNFKVDLRIGNSSDSPDFRPADGFSVNYARESDPVVQKVINGDIPVNADFASELPEAGTTTGIAVGFDTWAGNTLPDGPDIEGIIVRVDNVTVLRHPLPTRNGACDDPTSIQTGPVNPDDPTDLSTLCWQTLEIDLNENGVLNVFWKGTQILEDFQTSFVPSRGRLVFAGRTGGNNENHHVDNIVITTIPATSATLSSVVPGVDRFSFTLDDAPGSEVDPDSVEVTLDGSPIEVTVSKSGSVTTVSYVAPAGQKFASGSEHTFEVTFEDADNTHTESRIFVAPTYATVPASFAATDVNTAEPGFRIRPHQVTEANPNTIEWTEEQLAGLHGENRVDLELYQIPTDAEGFITWTEPLDFKNLDGGTGRFPYDFGFDSLGIPGVDQDGNLLPNEDNSALEILTFVEFPEAGLYVMNVNSDDGFRLQTAGDPRSVLATRLGEFNGGRGVGEGTTFNVWVEQAGIYPMRLLWENGGGGAGLEWTTVNEDGSHSLVGDASDANALRAFRTRASTIPYVSRVVPGRDATQAPAQPLVEVVIENAAQVTAGSVEIEVNGEELEVTENTSGGRLTATASVPSALPGGEVAEAVVRYTPAGGQPVEESWTFTVVSYETTLPLAGVGAPGSGSNPGFNVRVYQLDIPAGQADPGVRMVTELTWAEAVLAGLAGPNVADLTGFENGVYVETGVINYNQPNDAGTGLDSSGNFTPDVQIPGIPGLGTDGRDNIAAEITTYVEFPEAGVYIMGVNSDDGFKVTPGHAAPSPAVSVIAPASLAGGVAAVPSVRGDNQGGGIFAPLPATPIEADLVLAQGNSDAALPEEGCGTALANAAQVAGKVVLVYRGTCPFLEKVRNAANAGAVGVLVVQNVPDYPIIMGGDPNTIAIPALMISQADGEELRNATGVRVRIAGDTTPVLGSANVGRGATDTLFGFRVPQPGLYPLRLVWMEGGGGASVEWFSVAADGTKVLVNDTSNPQGLRAFRTVTVVENPTLAIERDGASVVLTYTGRLQSSPTVEGPYTDVADAPEDGPYTVAPDSGARFFRAVE